MADVTSATRVRAEGAAADAQPRARARAGPGGKKSPGAFRTISEVSQELVVPQHVLRFWETKFSQVRPMKRGGGRRYYRPEDVRLIRGIRELLYEDGYTIKGVQKLLREGGVKILTDRADTAVAQAAARPQAVVPPDDGEAGHDQQLQLILAELEEIKKLLTNQS